MSPYLFRVPLEGPNIKIKDNSDEKNDYSDKNCDYGD